MTKNLQGYFPAVFIDCGWSCRWSFHSSDRVLQKLNNCIRIDELEALSHIWADPLCSSWAIAIQHKQWALLRITCKKKLNGNRLLMKWTLLCTKYLENFFTARQKKNKDKFRFSSEKLKMCRQVFWKQVRNGDYWSSIFQQQKNRNLKLEIHVLYFPFNIWETKQILIKYYGLNNWLYHIWLPECVSHRHSHNKLLLFHE